MASVPLPDHNTGAAPTSVSASNNAAAGGASSSLAAGSNAGAATMTLVPTNPAAAASAEQSAKKSSRQSLSYAAERIVGNGSFGVVYQATVIETNEVVAIKKVLQDRRYKNREFDIMSMLKHPNVVTLKHSFYSPNEKGDVFLNLVMEFIPETVYRTLRTHTKARRMVPLIYTKCYMYQICRSLAYIHSLGICHRDIKPQNLLLNTRTHEVKLCDFGSAKVLVKDQVCHVTRSLSPLIVHLYRFE